MSNFRSRIKQILNLVTSLSCLWGIQLGLNLAVPVLEIHHQEQTGWTYIIHNCLQPFIMLLYSLYLFGIYIKSRCHKRGQNQQTDFQYKVQILKAVNDSSGRYKKVFALFWTLFMTVAQGFWVVYLITLNEKQCSHIIGQFMNLNLIVFWQPTIFLRILNFDCCNKKIKSSIIQSQSQIDNANSSFSSERLPNNSPLTSFDTSNTSSTSITSNTSNASNTATADSDNLSNRLLN